MRINGNIVDIRKRVIFSGEVVIEDGHITSINPIDGTFSNFIIPGFIDAHIHIESSMLVPSEFARLAVVHGTVATVSDPHEIANVCGIEGVKYMIENGKQTPFKFFFGAPSCVPATIFETAGASLDAKEVGTLLKDPEIFYLSEMMNYPGAINGEQEVLAKIAAAHRLSKPVDGHAPLLRGQAMAEYVARGISTDHECVSLAEALDKIEEGMKIIIREGSAARNFEALHPLLSSHPEYCMFGSDDKHPDSLAIEHINGVVVRAIAHGHDLYNVLQAACLNPIEHYKLPVGALQVGDQADFIVIKDLVSFQVLEVYINGQLVAKECENFITSSPILPINNFNCSPKKIADFAIELVYEDSINGVRKVRTIEAEDGQLVTKQILQPALIDKGSAICDIANDLLKLTVVNRYHDAKPALAFIKGFGLRRGAIASSVGHDCHNIIAVGCTDEELCRAVNLVIESKGGIAAVCGSEEMLLPLPIAGIMSNRAAEEVAKNYTAIDTYAGRVLGSPLQAPFMTLSFMALLVIPSLKLSDKGLFDGEKFEFVDLWV